MFLVIPTDPQDFIYGVSALGAFLGGFIFVAKSIASNKNVLKNWMSNKIAVPVQDLTNQLENSGIGDVHQKMETLNTSLKKEIIGNREEITSIQESLKKEIIGNRTEITQIRNELKSDVKELKEDLQGDIADIKATVDQVGRSVANLTGQLTVMQGGFWHPDKKDPNRPTHRDDESKGRPW